MMKKAKNEKEAKNIRNFFVPTPSRLCACPTSLTIDLYNENVVYIEHSFSCSEITKNGKKCKNINNVEKEMKRMDEKFNFLKFYNFFLSVFP